MIEVVDIQPINKGNLLCICNVHIGPWKLTMNEVKVFQKGTNRWLGLPSREFINDAGEKKYVELITFDSEAVKNRFRSQIMAAVDEHLASNPEMKTEPLISMDEEMPF